MTSFGVAWAIFIFMILFGAGQGLNEGVLRLFGHFAKNSIWLVGGSSSKTTVGNSSGKLILFDDEIVRTLKNSYPDFIDEISPEFLLPGSTQIRFENNFNNYRVIGVSKDYFNIKTLNASVGRTFNLLDDKENRLVAVIGDQVKNVLFGDNDPIGKSIELSGEWFTVIGVLEKGTVLNQSDLNRVYIPYTTASNYLTKGKKFNKLLISLKPFVSSSHVEQKISKFLSKKLNFDRTDERALVIINFDQQITYFNALFTGLKVFLSLIGLALLITGVVGVSNMMLVVVNERTKEFGIRKAFGANGKSILVLVFLESIFITLFSGIIGLLLGAIVIQLINKYVLSRVDISIFSELGLNLGITSLALIILVCAGCLAGLVPAKKAAKINPIEAIRDEI